jgi:hypothetical protein
MAACDRLDELRANKGGSVFVPASAGGGLAGRRRVEPVGAIGLMESWIASSESMRSESRYFMLESGGVTPASWLEAAE